MEKIFARSDGARLEILYPPYCDICGNPIPDSFATTHPYCGACKDDPDKKDPIIRNRAFGKYYYGDEKPDDLLSNEIRRLKTDNRILPLLLECLYHAIDTMHPHLASMDIVVPVMRGSDDEGFNQSALLAEGIATRYKKPYLDILYKKEQYRSMHTIHNVKEKEKEISGKIGCKHKFRGESILLVDDTCITLTTKRECAKVLRDHGAGEIQSLVIGRMVNQNHMATIRRYNG
jgi:predicted amidophosphoribosyltransferase